MAYSCQLCGKKGMRGNLVSHSKQRTKRVFRPNLREARILVGGMWKRVRICTDCLKKIKEQRAKIQKSEVEITREEREKPGMVVEKEEVKKETAVIGDLALAQEIIKEDLKKQEPKVKKSKKTGKAEKS